jgi:NO-binding membrane sensor protein with MHYT domain
LAGGGIAMGIGVWAMHFIGMLAMDLSMSMSYNATLTVISMVIAIGASLFALWFVSCDELRLRRLLPGALVMGRYCCHALHRHGSAGVNPPLSGICSGWPFRSSLRLPLLLPHYG